MDENKKAFLALFIATLAWSFSFILVKVGLKEITPITFASLRFLLATAFLLCLKPFFGNVFKSKGVRKSDLPKFLILGLSGVTGYHLFFFLGINYTTAISASVLGNTAPIFIAILSAIFLKERMNWMKITGILIAFIGTICIITKLEPVLFSSHVVGDILIVASILSWAIYTIVGKPMLQRYEPMMVTFYSMLVGTPFLVIAALAKEDVRIIANLSIGLWIIVVYLAIVCSAIGYFLWYEGLKRMEPSKAGVFIFTIPIYTIILSILFLGETLTYPIVLGTILVMLGVYLTEKA